MKTKQKEDDQFLQGCLNDFSLESKEDSKYSQQEYKLTQNHLTRDTVKIDQDLEEIIQKLKSNVSQPESNPSILKRMYDFFWKDEKQQETTTKSDTQDTTNIETDMSKSQSYSSNSEWLEDNKTVMERTELLNEYENFIQQKEEELLKQIVSYSRPDIANKYFSQKVSSNNVFG